MVDPVVEGYTKGCRVVHPAWYCRAVVVYVAVYRSVILRVVHLT